MHNTALPSRRSNALARLTGTICMMAVMLSFAFTGAATAQDISIDIGELPVGRSVTITYRATLQEIPQATMMVSNQGTVLSNERPPMLTDDPTLPGDADATMTEVFARVQDRVSSSEKGSLLYFAAVDVRWATGAGPGSFSLKRDTFLTLTNDFPEDVRIRMFFVNGDPPLEADPATGEREHYGWNWVNNTISLTSDQPTYWSVATGLPSTGGVAPFTILDPGDPPGRPADDGTGDRMLRGFVIAYAIDRLTNEEIRWNHLSGTGTIVDYVDGTAWEYQSYNHAVVARVTNGMPTGMDPAVLNLDDVEYSSGYSQLLMNFQAVGSFAFSGPRLITSDTQLSLLPENLDLRQDNCGPTTTKASFNVWNENEVKFSGTHRCVTCWDGTLLSQYGGDGNSINNFLVGHLQTQHGKTRLDGLASQVCDVDVNSSDGPFPPADPCLPDATGHPDDVVSTFTPLLGVVTRLLTFDGGLDTATAGTNLYGLGKESGVVQLDLPNNPQELTLPPQPTPDELRHFLDQFLGQFSTP